MSRILVIDDDAPIRIVLQQTLERAGYEVINAPDGDVGMKLQSEEPADLVITDILMPEKEGIETIMELHRDFPGVKIIAISGGGRIESDTYLSLAKKMGVQRTLNKPFERKELLEAVRELIDGTEE